MKLKLISTARHRNGVAGAPFDVVLFSDRGTGGSRKVGILFDRAGYCAVFDVSKLAAGDIAFGSNSWRGDDYEPSLREAIGEGDHVPSEIKVDQLLASRRQVAIVWSVEDVRGVRPDLSDEQAWEVLQECRDRHDSEWGFTWTLIEVIAQEMFPKPATSKE